MSLILAIDQSTSATKSLVYDMQGTLLDRFSIEHRAIYPQPGWVEHDAEELWRNTLAVIVQALVRHEGFAFLSITNQRETFVIFDRATGRPLHNAVVWQCRRGDQVCAELLANQHADLVERKTGLRIDSYFSAPKLCALLRAQRQLRAKLQAGEALFGTIDTYLLYRLTSGKTFATDSTNASRTLLFDISALAWDAELCELFEVPARALPEVRDGIGRFGVIDCPEIFNPLPIAGVMGDSQAALFAHRCFLPGQAKITLGTGSSILLNTGSQLPSTGIRTLAWTQEGVARYSAEGIISYSAATIAWLRDGLGLIRSAAETEPAARAVPDNGGVYLVPAFTGLSAPYWSPDARAAIVGLSAASTRNHVIRAALESIAYQIVDVLNSLLIEGATPLQLIHVDGGASRNDFLVQFLADLAGATIAVNRVTDLSPLGAAFAGMMAMKVCSRDQLAQLPVQEKLFYPELSRGAAESLMSGWHKAVQQVLSAVENRG